MTTLKCEIRSKSLSILGCKSNKTHRLRGIIEMLSLLTNILFVLRQMDYNYCLIYIHPRSVIRYENLYNHLDIRYSFILMFKRLRLSPMP